jgi:hypothetical protein
MPFNNAFLPELLVNGTIVLAYCLELTERKATSNFIVFAHFRQKWKYNKISTWPGLISDLEISKMSCDDIKHKYMYWLSV